MFPKCSLDARNIATLTEHSVNISGILRAGWVRTLSKLKKDSMKNLKTSVIGLLITN